MTTYITEYLTVLLFLLADDSSASFALPTTIRRLNTRTSQQPRPSLWQKQSSSPPHHTVTTTLHQSRDNDRARMEKSWENMMGEDWREFRAQLVAREHLDQDQMNLGTSKAAGQDGNKKEEGGIFGAITSIFKKDENKNKGSSDNNTQTERDVVTKAAKTKKDETSSSSGNIFDGVDVGGATKFSKIEVPMGCSDPFMDEEECHLIYDEPVVINKHRWAHPLFNVEPGCILVANEKLGGVFHQTVVLIIDHNEATGSTGMVINRPFPGNLMKIASDSESNIDTTLKTAFSKAPVAYGGPVMQDQFSTLHGFGEVKGSKKICPGVFVGGSARLMQEVRRNNLDPTQVLFVKGHAAWVPGQLTREIEKGVWYIAAASADFLLRYAGAPVSKDDNPSDLWADVMMCMGSKFESIATSHSGRGDDRMMP